MKHTTLADLTRPRGTVRTLSRQEELSLLRDHLLRLDRTSRHDRFHGFMDDSFIKRYAEKCANDGTLVIAYLEDGAVRGAAELHPPQQSDDGVPEVAFSVEIDVFSQIAPRVEAPRDAVLIVDFSLRCSPGMLLG